MPKKKAKQVFNTTYKFRPQEMSRKHRIISGISNFVPRTTAYHEWAERPLNEIVLGRISGKIHSHTCHGVNVGRIRWNAANIRFQSRYPKKSSDNYHNTWSVGRFL